MTIYRLNEIDKQEALDLLKEVLAIDTQNPPGNEADLAEFFCQKFKAHGFAAKVINKKNNRANVVAMDQSVFDEYKNLLESEESGSPTPNPNKPLFCLNGHLDTVPVGDLSKWCGNPLKPREMQKEGKDFLVARGSVDMKSGLTAAAVALLIAKREKLNIKDTLFLGTYDEESNGEGAENFTKTALFKAIDQVVIGEPTALKLGIAAKGTLWLQLKVFGKTSHAAYPEEGRNAIEAGVAVYNKLKSIVEDDDHPLLSNSTCTLSLISGGVKVNMIPDKAELILDIRLNPERDQAELLRLVQKLIEDEMKKFSCSCEVEVINQRMSVKLSEESRLYKKALACHSKLFPEFGSEVNSGARFFSDGSKYKIANPDLEILVFGPGEPEVCHQPEEHLEIQQYYRAIEYYIELLMEE